MIYSRDPVKNTNKISIFYYFLDTVVKPRYDIESVFRSTLAMPPRYDKWWLESHFAIR
ncbi:MAG: palindromic element RPE4 domain-containing protein [Rickettsia endosymbiont of Stiretrus anchorago]|nr:palindromic element RPE4 domain-containing protein [Rickettsia endosymbiont of Stiretrus anchorago]